MNRAKDGGPAFPTLGDEFIQSPHGGLEPKSAFGMEGAPGMSLKDYFMAHAPVTFEMAVQAYGASPNLCNDMERRCFFAVWCLLRKEYAEQMLDEREGV